MAFQITCPNCGNELVLNNLNTGDEFKCRHCGVRGVVPEKVEPVKPYKTVRILASITKFVAWVLSIAFLVFGLYAMSKGAVLPALGYIAGGILVLIVNLAIAELLLVVLAIEENTRRLPK